VRAASSAGATPRTSLLGAELNWSMDAPNWIDWRRENERFIHQQWKKETESNQVSMCATMTRIKNHETNLFT
jgi:hypothetical protein